MRITNSMMMNDYLSNLSGNLNRLSKYLEQETTGKSITNISDDPVGVTKSLLARNRLSSTGRHTDNVKTTNSWLTEVESAVGELNHVIQSAYEHAVAASTGTLSEGDLAAIAEEIGHLRDEVLGAANSTVGSSYLFAGYNTTGTSDGALPFTVDPSGDIYYNGINMSNEASANYIAGAQASASKALDKVAAANAIAQAADLSDRNEIIANINKAAGYIREISKAGLRAAAEAKDIGDSAGVGGTMMASLLSNASSAARTAAEEAAASADAAAGASEAARAAADDEEKAYSAWRDAVGTVDEAEAHGAYLEAKAAADTATETARAASADAAAKAGTAGSAIDTINGIVTASDAFIGSISAVAAEETTAGMAAATGNYATVTASSDKASQSALRAAEAAQVFASSGAVIGAGAASDIADAIAAVQAAAAAAEASGAAASDPATAALAVGAITAVKTALADLEDCVGNFVPGFDALSMESLSLDGESGDSLSLQVGSGHTMEISVPGTELLGRGSDNIYVMLDGFYKALTSGADTDEVNDYIGQLQGAQNRILSLEARVGARMERLDTLSKRYGANTVNYTQMRSDAEDVDLAEAIMNYSTAETVYNAALAAGAQVIQTSLIDFLR